MNISLGSKHLLAFRIDNGVSQVAELRVHAKNVSVLKSFSVLTVNGTVEDDGTLVATGKNEKCQCNVSNWRLFYPPRR